MAAGTHARPRIVVYLASMPQGVEHTIRDAAEALVPVVYLASMPQGVEHRRRLALHFGGGHALSANVNQDTSNQ